MMIVITVPVVVRQGLGAVNMARPPHARVHPVHLMNIAHECQTDPITIVFMIKLSLNQCNLSFLNIKSQTLSSIQPALWQRLCILGRYGAIEIVLLLLLLLLLLLPMASQFNKHTFHMHLIGRRRNINV